MMSPCLSICILEEADTGDKNDDYCIGCFRTIREIQFWNTFSEEEQAKIMEELPKREESLL
jgi:predicted Fe-S protein YdhL (DUF1289 family)